MDWEEEERLYADNAEREEGVREAVEIMHA